MSGRDEASLAGALKPLHTRYAQHINRTRGVSGRLWQGRFFSCPLDEEHLWSAVRYVERNPVRAGLVERAEDYRLPTTDNRQPTTAGRAPQLTVPCVLTAC